MGDRRLGWKAKLLVGVAVLLALGLVVAVSVVGYRRARLPLFVIETKIARVRSELLDDGHLLAVWSDDGRPRVDVWSVETGSRVAHIKDSAATRVPNGYGRGHWTAGQRGTLLAFDHEATPPQAGWWIRLVSAATGADLRTIKAPDDFVTDQLSPRGDLIALVDSAHRTEVRATSDGSLVRVLGPPPGTFPETGSQFPPMFSAHGELLAIPVGSSSYVYSVSDGSIACVVSADEVWSFTDRLNPIGLSGLDGNGGPQIAVYSLAGGQQRRVLVPDTNGIYMAFPIGASAFGIAPIPCGDDFIWVRSVETDELRRKVRLHTGSSMPFSLSPSGDRLAISFLDGRIEVWEIPP